MLFYYMDIGWRSLRRTPLVSILMVCAIAIGIGITMTSLSVYHMMSMDPIPAKSDRLFAVQLNTMDDNTDWWSDDNMPFQLTFKDAMHLHKLKLNDRDENIDIRKTAMLVAQFAVHMNNDEMAPFLAMTRIAGREFFPMFEREFVYGSSWSQEQENNAEAVIVINQELNERLFGGSNSVGKEIYLDDTPFRIVGVMQQWDIHTKFYDVNNGPFDSPEPIFMPITLVEPNQIDTAGNTNGWKYGDINSWEDFLQSENFWLQFWVELDNKQETQRFEDYLLAYLTEEATKGRFEREVPSFSVRDVNNWLDYRGVVSEDNKVLVGLSFLFLAVCLANILGLLLGKFLRRAPEVGVRRALGASKRQVFLQHLVEVSILGLLGGSLGIAIAQLGLWGVRTTSGNYQALATMDLGMLLAAPAIAIVSCIIAGLYPAWLVCKTQPAIYLKTQ
ncbi:ABC transporter permease [Glaciecola sp. MH2013]|uniref:ABC transporter permease n=1 Tax=Glaciecola sp. MH2013 TaxID=2785524 RepID=UPI0018A05137|nr:ABC transporter permease [Glaciecola sp. MH2013]MBF7074516.1 ABC transporter permease [Glaciecola sp. MH2013]